MPREVNKVDVEPAVNKILDIGHSHWAVLPPFDTKKGRNHLSGLFSAQTTPSKLPSELLIKPAE
jgi:hypothetical protein